MSQSTSDSPIQLLTDKNSVQDFLLQAYVEACESQNPGLLERTIEAVSAEMLEMLAVRFVLPFQKVPDVIKKIASIFAAYRTVQAITSLVATEASTDNEWLPLQKQWENCNKLLQDIISGKIKLPAAEKENIALDREDADFMVISPAKTFDFSKF